MSLGTAAITAVGLQSEAPLVSQLGHQATASAGDSTSVDFSSILSGGLEAVDSKLERADALVRQFAVDDSIPVHQVTLALEEARLSVEMAMQVRARLVETYREFMNMQL